MDSVETSSERIAVDDLKNLIGELRMMARRFLHAEVRNHSFTPTALAMTALRRVKLKEQDWNDVRWENRAHFFSMISAAMRHALIDYARHRKARGRDQILYFAPDDLLFQDVASQAEEKPDQLILVEEAFARLELADERLASVVRQFYFLGHSTREIAETSEVSEKTIDRDLKRARVLLRKMLGDPVKVP